MEGEEQGICAELPVRELAGDALEDPTPNTTQNSPSATSLFPGMTAGSL